MFGRDFFLYFFLFYDDKECVASNNRSIKSAQILTLWFERFTKAENHQVYCAKYSAACILSVNSYFVCFKLEIQFLKIFHQCLNTRIIQKVLSLIQKESGKQNRFLLFFTIDHLNINALSPMQSHHRRRWNHGSPKTLSQHLWPCFQNGEQAGEIRV